jgi:hypothetical protein
MSGIDTKISQTEGGKMFVFKAIQKLVLWFTSSPIITAIITTLILEFKKEGDSLFTFALNSIKEAIALDMDNAERFNYVKSKLVRKFPESSENLINAVIESVLILYKKQ